MGSNYQSRPAGTVIRYIVIHTNQGPHLPNQHPDYSAENLATYLTSTGNTPDPVSYHVLVDDDSLITYLTDDQEAWAAFASNPIGLHLCFLGMAEWSRADWLAHPGMIYQAAIKVRQWCDIHRIPVIHRSPTSIVDGMIGIIGHADWTYAAKMMNPSAQDSHTDPGVSFPWDVFLNQVSSGISQRSNDMAVVERVIPPGKGIALFHAPTGKASLLTSQAWISSGVIGPSNGTIRYWFQDDIGGISDSGRNVPLPFMNGHSVRFWAPLPDGTTQIRAEYDFPDGGTITIELEPK